MRVVCLCPTYGRPSMARNALALFLRQSLWYGHTAEMLVFADDGLIPAQRGGCGSLTWEVMTEESWVPLTEKYAPMLSHARASGPVDAWVVWDDDDVYLPWHLQAHLIALGHGAWSHPSRAWSTYGIDPRKQPPARRDLGGRHYHGALAVRDDLMQHLGGWPVTERSDYDKQMLAACRRESGPPADPCTWDEPSYVYRWSDTNRSHCSAHIQDGKYRQPPIQEQPINDLTPHMDDSTVALLNRLAPQIEHTNV